MCTAMIIDVCAPFSLIFSNCIADGGHLPGTEHSELCGHQMDSSHGLLRHVQFTFDENMASVAHLPSHIGTQIATHWSTTPPMANAHSTRLFCLPRRVDTFWSTDGGVYPYRTDDALHAMLVQLVGSQSRHWYSNYSIIPSSMHFP